MDSNGGTFNTVNIAFTPATLSCGQGTPPPCAASSSNTSNFNGTPISGGNYIWFNANFTASGVPSSGATVSFTNSSIHFTADQDYNLAVPNAQITFSPSASCATTSFDSTTFTTDYNALSAKPTHSNSCSFNNSDHAGTPEGTDSSSGRPFKAFVTGGARGGGGSNFTGSWSGTLSVSPACPSSAIIGKPGAFCKV